MVGMWIARCGVMLDKLVSLCHGGSDQLRQGRRRAELKTLSEQNGRAAAENEEVGVNGEAGDDAGTGSTVRTYESNYDTCDSTNGAGTLGSADGWLWITLAAPGNGFSLIQEMSHENWASTDNPRCSDLFTFPVLGGEDESIIYPIIDKKRNHVEVMPHSASAEPGQEGRLIRNSRCRLYCLAPSEGMPTVFVQMRTNCAVDRQSLTGARRTGLNDPLTNVATNMVSSPSEIGVPWRNGCMIDCHSVVGNPFSSVLRLHLPCRLLTGISTWIEDQDISQLDDAGKWGRRAF
ncbi:hypothetical protein An02g04950 [Aspergillus niger]|uniref:Uncharacterized protein n=2 Tax=Aspergillus niger TaxID=5061 RepID=A2QCW3_ASPNC|nr:hypothetical protein An02g04950 [Aspergillus niger]CAK37603.1 hypothetical protein An02g04950 [Aspergillus niger]